VGIMGAGCRSVLAGALVVLLGLPAAATDAVRRDAEIVGVASVIDGDTLEIHGRRIRLDAIDAPEAAQLCLRDGRKERCGQASAFFLADLVGRRTVRCVPHDVDRYGRDIATCWLDGVNLNERMVAAGQAVAYRKYSQRYVAAERKAEAAGLGLWSTRFEMPWDYRRAH
jgi:endonuclease YncB( thermonuclease family)